MKIPTEGLRKNAVLDELRTYGSADLDWRSGRTFGYVYDAGREAEDVARAASALFLSDNALDPTAFPSLLRLENEIVAMAAAHVEATADVAGNVTSGGTESIILAVKTARDLFRARHPAAGTPHMVLPVTAHAAFHKAAHYLGVDVVQTPVNLVSFRADVDAVRAAVGPETMLIVGSAPSYAHGVVDPIRQLAAIALEHGVPFHVDACVGGFLLPYLRRLGEDIPDFDFRVPGVTSISMDLHKYAYVPKGASVILHRSADLRRHQFYACCRWTGYGVVNATVQSSKSGGPLAAAWAVLRHIGDDGYLRMAREVRDATRAIVGGIERIPGLRMLGRPDMSLVAFASDAVDVFHVVDEMKERGWYVQAQLGFAGSPPNVHLTICPSNAPHVEAFLRDLTASVEAARALPPALTLPMDPSSLDPSSLTPEMFAQMLAMVGVEDGRLPRRMAGINGILAALPPEATERLMVEFLNGMYRRP